MNSASKDLRHECRYLYRNFTLVFLGLSVYFWCVEAYPMVIANVVGLAVYITGYLTLRKTDRISFWILMIPLTVGVHAMCGNFLVGWGYGFTFYELLMIPLTFNLTYSDESIKNMMRWAMAISGMVVLMSLVSCIVMSEYNKVDKAADWQIATVFVLNFFLSSLSLIRYSYEFIKENIAKTVSLAMKNKELDFRANYDPLTGLYNRGLFMEQTELLLHLYSDTKFCMVCTDIKDFKIVNDLYGSETGDKVLLTQAELFRGIAGEMSVYGRIGADKFAICMPMDSYDDAIFLVGMEKLKNIFAKSSYHLYIYVGVYEITDNHEAPNVLCDKAMLALQSIKGDYQKVLAHYENKLLDSELAHKQMLGDFEPAIEGHQFCIYLQPQTDQDGKVRGAEALVRWIHPENGMIMPGTFIPCFEQAGLISRLDCYVWELAVKQLHAWKKIGREDLHISVNISTKDFYFVDVYNVITELVKEYGVNTRNLRLEITESALAVNFNEIIAVLSKLHADGFIIELDDFGSGYSSFNVLKDLCADVIKIDREFLRETQNEKRSKDILEGIIALSAKMNMDVITEGVETREQVDMLTNMGCRIFQGYYFSKPIPLDEFEKKYVEA